MHSYSEVSIQDTKVRAPYTYPPSCCANLYKTPIPAWIMISASAAPYLKLSDVSITPTHGAH